MAKIEHLYSITSGHVPSLLLRGQLATNIPDQIVYANTPDGVVDQISNGVTGVANASTLLGAHIPIQFHPVVQFGPRHTAADLAAKFVVSGATATLAPMGIFGLGQMVYTPVLTCASINTGVYQLTVNLIARTASIIGVSAPMPSNSGVMNPINSTYTIIFCSETTNIQPWFYVPVFQGASNGDTLLYRVSNVQTFGAIPVSTGFAGANAASYWGHT